MSQFRFYPQNAVWEITFACNMRCLHCGTSAGKIRPDELSTDEAFQVIDDLADLGCEMVTLSGGEPLLRPDWRELAKRIKERGMRLYLITNGYAVTQDIVDDFKRLEFENIGVSFDGNAEVHNHIRQRDDSFQRVLKTFDLLRDAGQLFCAVSQISNMNLGVMDEIRQILIDHGCPVWRIQMTTSTGRMQKDLVMGIENYPAFIDKILEYQKMGGIAIDVGENIGYYGCKGTELLEGTPYLGCYAGVRVIGICSNGDIKGCLSMQEQFVEGNVREKSLVKIWNNPDGFAYNRQFSRSAAGGACRECRYLALCRGGCATTSVSATGCRADNPYCIYQIEKAQGIEPRDSEAIQYMLKEHGKMEEVSEAS